MVGCTALAILATSALAAVELIPQLLPTCIGDCDGRGDVSIDEIIRLVNVALGEASADNCFAADGNGDGEVAIDDLLMAVNGALEGCGDSRSQAVDAIIAPVANDTTPAAAVLVSQGNRVVHRKVYGLANVATGEPATADNVFLLASLSKPFTSLAILKLVEQHRISLDDPVAEYLPELQRFGVGVTIRHLLQHTSGLPDYYEEPLWSVLRQITPYPTNADGLALLSTQGEPMFAPGEQFHYLNGGFELLALIVERVSGQRFSDFQQNLIFDAVGMPRTFSIPRPERETTARYACSYEAQPGNHFRRFEYDPSVYMYGSGDVVSNIDDLSRFDRALFAGAIVGRELLDQAFVPVRFNDGSEPLVPYIPDTRYGFGWFISSRGSHPYVGHEGIYLGYRTYYAHFHDLTVFVLMARDYDYSRFISRIVLPIADIYLPTVNRYADNGDGTITDTFTGLMWEKKSDDDSVHDQDRLYRSDFAAMLNADEGFAGYRDWRLPNLEELRSIVDDGTSDPAVSPVFNTACAPGCAVTTCSCTKSAFYQSTTETGTERWGVRFDDGTVTSLILSYFPRVRAVRGSF